MSAAAQRWFARRPKTAVFLAALAAAVALLFVFDWDWLRPALERHLSETSGRSVRVGHMHVTMGFALEPTVRFRGVHIENARWASTQRPLAALGEMSFTFSLASVWRGRPVISRLTLSDGEVDMERTADGLRNWRLRQPDDREPGRVTVQTLEAQRTTLRFVNRAIDLELAAVATDLKPAQDAAQPPLSARVAFEGRYRGARFAGEALNGGVLGFRDSGLSLPMVGHVASGGTRLDFEGHFTDLFDLGAMDAHVKLAGRSLSELHPFVRVQPPPSRGYVFEADLEQRGAVYNFRRLQGRIGRSALAGEVTYDRSAERPVLNAALKSEAATLEDVAPLAGLRMTPSGRRGRDMTDAHSGSDAPGSASDRMFPTRAFRVEPLQSFDARIRFSAARFTAAAAPLLDSLRFDAALDRGKLELKPLAIGLAGGRAAGSVVFDARVDPPTAAVSLDVRGVALERLVPALSAKARATGAIRARIEVSGRGKSIAALLADTTGSVDAALGAGQISNFADAKLGLDFGRMIGAFLRGERAIGIHCGAAAFDFQRGIGRARTIVLDTDRTHVDGSGSLDLRGERVDLLLTPEPRTPTLFARRASIAVRGRLTSPSISTAPRVQQAHGASSRCNA